MLLKNNRRIQALITLICLALLIFSLANAPYASPPAKRSP